MNERKYSVGYQNAWLDGYTGRDLDPSNSDPEASEAYDAGVRSRADRDRREPKLRRIAADIRAKKSR